MKNHKEHNKESYDEIAYSYLNNNTKEPDYLNTFFDNIDKGLDILDIGCGPGNLVPLLLSKDPKLIVCIDNSPNMLKLAKHRFNNKNIKFIETDLETYCPKEKFGFIIAHLVFVHTPPQELIPTLGKIKNMLLPDSYFFANYFLSDKNEFKLIKLDYGRDDETRYFGLYNKEYIDECYAKAGFNITKKDVYIGKHNNRYNILAKN